MKRIVLFVFLFTNVITTFGVTTFNDANNAYKKGDFAGALSIYQELLAPGEQSSEVYYNMGNCYYRMGEMAQSILNYERALLLDPSNDDIRTNLSLAKSKCKDKVEEVGVFFPIQVFYWFQNSASSNGWAIISIVLVIIGMVCVLLYLFLKELWVRKVGFFGGVICLILAIAAGFFSYRQKVKIQNRNDAIVMAGSVTVTSTPAESGTALVVIHEGTKVHVVSTIEDWWEVKLPNGTIGWIKSDVAEKI